MLALESRFIKISEPVLLTSVEEAQSRVSKVIGTQIARNAGNAAPAAALQGPIAPALPQAQGQALPPALARVQQELSKNSFLRQEAQL